MVGREYIRRGTFTIITDREGGKEEGSVRAWRSHCGAIHVPSVSKATFMHCHSKMRVYLLSLVFPHNV